MLKFIYHFLKSLKIDDPVIGMINIYANQAILIAKEN